MSFIWEAIVMPSFGFLLIRMIGKKTVSEMTGPEIVTLLSMASVIGHAISENSVWKTIVVISIFGSLLITLQFLSMKFNGIERFILGKATVIIEDGRILPHNLRKLRLTVDQLETKLRQNGISSFSDVKCATIEMDGALGYELKRTARPVTVGDMEQWLARFQLIAPVEKDESQANIFDELYAHRQEENIPQSLQ